MPHVGHSIQDLQPRRNRPRPKEDPEAVNVTELQEVQLRMASLATVEPIMEILREVVGSAATSCEPGKLRLSGARVMVMVEAFLGFLRWRKDLEKMEKRWITWMYLVDLVESW